MSRLLHSTTKKFSRIGGSRIIRQLSGSEEVLSKTAFFDLHNELGGKMVSFAGYSLPVQVIMMYKLTALVQKYSPQ
jgi:hypothetical protein